MERDRSPPSPFLWAATKRTIRPRPDTAAAHAEVSVPRHGAGRHPVDSSSVRPLRGYHGAVDRHQRCQHPPPRRRARPDSRRRYRCGPMACRLSGDTAATARIGAWTRLPMVVYVVVVVVELQSLPPLPLASLTPPRLPPPLSPARFLAPEPPHTTNRTPTPACFVPMSDHPLWHRTADHSWWWPRLHGSVPCWRSANAARPPPPLLPKGSADSRGSQIAHRSSCGQWLAAAHSSLSDGPLPPRAASVVAWRRSPQPVQVPLSVLR